MPNLVKLDSPTPPCEVLWIDLGVGHFGGSWERFLSCSLVLTVAFSVASDGFGLMTNLETPCALKSLSLNTASVFSACPPGGPQLCIPSDLPERQLFLEASPLRPQTTGPSPPLNVSDPCSVYFL